jgi:hypothetical protein
MITDRGGQADKDPSHKYNHKLLKRQASDIEELALYN